MSYPTDGRDVARASAPPRAAPPPWIWMGPVVDEKEMLSGPAVSPAANRWQLGLLRGLGAAGQAVEVLSYVPERAWPRGPLRKATVRESRVPGVEITTVGYLNVPALRQWSLGRRHRSELRRRIAAGSRPGAILTYNAPEGPANAALELQESEGIPWVVVVSDVDGQASPGAVESYLSRIGRAAGRVALSWEVYESVCGGPKLHLDGGVESLRAGPDPTHRKAFLYAGMLGRHGGVDLLLEAFREIRDPGVELWICGKLAPPGFVERVAADPRVRFFGAVSEEELGRLSVAAAAFVNPRPPAIAESNFNFPSKVLEYLSYGKPVVSTWTPGLAPEYREVLVVAEEATPAALARSMEDVLGWDSGRREAQARAIVAFLQRGKLWSSQAARLRRWVEDVVRQGGARG